MIASDLDAVYGAPAGPVAQGMGRQTLAELRAYYAQKTAELARVKGECGDCAHLSGRVCRKFNATIPANYTGADCDEWQYDEIPF